MHALFCHFQMHLGVVMMGTVLVVTLFTNPAQGSAGRVSRLAEDFLGLAYALVAGTSSREFGCANNSTAMKLDFM